MIVTTLHVTDIHNKNSQKHATWPSTYTDLTEHYQVFRPVNHPFDQHVIIQHEYMK